MSNGEARAFGRYVIGRDIDERTGDLYVRASNRLRCDGDAVATFAVDHPWSIGALDAALALRKPDAPLRQKLLLMAAILETQPAYYDAFLPRDRSRHYVAIVAYAIGRSALQALVGLVLLRLVR